MLESVCILHGVGKTLKHALQVPLKVYMPSLQVYLNLQEVDGSSSLMYDLAEITLLEPDKTMHLHSRVLPDEHSRVMYIENNLTL